MVAKRVLVVDDEEPIQDVIQGCLEDVGGWEVLRAASGGEGVDLARSRLPDGILLDVSMPGMDGFEVLQRLQADPATQLIPVILLTARVQPEDRAKFAELAITGVILKPFDPMALVDQVAAAFGWEM
ncbi:response regulator [Leptolyngbyaceae cyanobacterium UHCC 1019]